MRIAIGIYFLVHGLCHFVGFVVPWKILTMKDEPYKTTLVAGSINVGDVGIRVVGLLWLIAGVGSPCSTYSWRNGWKNWRAGSSGNEAIRYTMLATASKGNRSGRSFSAFTCQSASAGEISCVWPPMIIRVMTWAPSGSARTCRAA